MKTLTSIFFASLLAFYTYAWATVEPVPIWEPVFNGCCYWIGGTLVCLPCHEAD